MNHKIFDYEQVPYLKFYMEHTIIRRKDEKKWFVNRIYKVRYLSRDKMFVYVSLTRTKWYLGIRIVQIQKKLRNQSGDKWHRRNIIKNKCLYLDDIKYICLDYDLNSLFVQPFSLQTFTRNILIQKICLFYLFVVICFDNVIYIYIYIYIYVGYESKIRNILIVITDYYQTRLF